MKMPAAVMMFLATAAVAPAQTTVQYKSPAGIEYRSQFADGG